MLDRLNEIDEITNYELYIQNEFKKTVYNISHWDSGSEYIKGLKKL